MKRRKRQLFIRGRKIESDAGSPKMGLAEIRPVLAQGRPLVRGCVLHDLINCVRRTDILNIDFEKPFSNKFDQRPSQ